MSTFNNNMKPTTETIYMWSKQTDDGGDMVWSLYLWTSYLRNWNVQLMTSTMITPPAPFILQTYHTIPD